jgi:thiol-disulfide isomerase/thioredoxin
MKYFNYKWLITVVFVIYGEVVQAQVQKIRLDTVSLATASDLYLNIKVFLTIDSFSTAKKPLSIGSNSRVYTYQMNYENYIYWKQKIGRLSLERYEKALKLYNIDSNTIYKGRLLNSAIKVLVYKTLNNQYQYIVDANNDNDFTNDVVVSTSGNRQVQRISNLDNFHQGHLITQSIIVKNIIIDTVAFDADPKYAVSALITPYKAGQLVDASGTYNLLLYQFVDNTSGYLKTEAKLFLLHENQRFSKRMEPHEMYDTFSTATNYYWVDTLDACGEFLTIKSSINASGKQYGFNTGNFIPETVTNPSRPEAKYFNKKRYVFIDYWGTWCGPCAEIQPRVAAVKKKIQQSSLRDSVIFLAVAFEKPETVKNYPTIARKKYASWQNILLTSLKEINIATIFKVYSFPTLLLVSPDGVILGRFSGSNKMDEVEKLVDSLIPPVQNIK